MPNRVKIIVNDFSLLFNNPILPLLCWVGLLLFSYMRYFNIFSCKLIKFIFFNKTIILALFYSYHSASSQFIIQVHFYYLGNKRTVLNIWKAYGPFIFPLTSGNTCPNAAQFIASSTFTFTLLFNQWWSISNRDLFLFLF